MRLVARISRVITDRLCCWFTAGNDAVRPDHPPTIWQGHRTTLQDRRLDAGPACDRASVLICGNAAGFTKADAAPTAPAKSP